MFCPSTGMYIDSLKPGLNVFKSIGGRGIRIKARYFLKKKEAKKLMIELKEKLESSIDLGQPKMEVIDFGEPPRIVLVDNEPLIIDYDGRYFLTVLGALRYRPKSKRVVVDKGAIPYVMNGADIMRPGIVEVDENICKDDFVIVVEEEKQTPIAIGIALDDGKNMKGDKGKVVKSIHYVGDKLWKFFTGTK
jgi:PUA domain protein